MALIDTTDMAATKQKFGLPEKLEGCHTATVLGYVIEGLIPAQFISDAAAEDVDGSRSRSALPLARAPPCPVFHRRRRRPTSSCRR